MILGLGTLFEAAGEIERAASHYEEAAGRFAAMSHLAKEGEALLGLARAAAGTQRDIAAARQRFHQARRKFEDAGDRQGEAVVDLHEGEFLLSWGDESGATEALSRASLFFAVVGNRKLEARAQAGLDRVSPAR